VLLKPQYIVGTHKNTGCPDLNKYYGNMQKDTEKSNDSISSKVETIVK
jgi:hypothetical protein